MKSRNSKLISTAVCMLLICAIWDNALTQTVTIPAGTRLMVRVDDDIDSRRHRAGHRFTARLEGDLVVNGRTVAPRGSQVYGRLSDAKQSGRMFGKSELRLELTDILIQNQLQPVMTGQSQIAAESQTGKTFKKAGRGALLGGIIGGIAGGSDSIGKGLAIGAAVGAGSQILTGGESVNVPRGTLLEFRMTQPLTVQFRS